MGCHFCVFGESWDCSNCNWLDMFHTLSPCSMQQHAMWRARMAPWWRNESVWADVANMDTKSRMVVRISQPTSVDLVALAEMMTATSTAFESTLRTSWLSSTTSGTPSPVVTGDLMAVMTVMMLTRIGGGLVDDDDDGDWGLFGDIDDDSWWPFGDNDDSNDWWPSGSDDDDSWWDLGGSDGSSHGVRPVHPRTGNRPTRKPYSGRPTAKPVTPEHWTPNCSLCICFVALDV